MCPLVFRILQLQRERTTLSSIPSQYKCTV
jgi:hypothetical protein